MKTIEKAREYARNGVSLCMDTSDEQDIYCEDLIQAYLAGAQSEREELTRWRDPKKELPELLTPVLGKQSDAKKTYYKVVYRREYDDDIGYYWTDNGCRSLYIDGWRPILEDE